MSVPVRRILGMESTTCWLWRSS